jgi:hypothetical protein
VSIDDFSLTIQPPIDMEMIAITNPSGPLPSGTQENVRVRVQNYGSDTIQNFNVSYQMSAGPPVTETYIGTLTPGAIADYTFLTSITVPAGLYALCTRVTAGGDTIPGNDTICSSYHGIPRYSLPYADNFDGVPVWSDSVAGNPSTHWELGTPNYGVTTGAYSNPNAWDINLGTAYDPSALAYLSSPFFDFTNQRDVTLRFWQNYNTLNGEDGMRIQYNTTGNILDWLDIGTTGNLDAHNWYNDTITSSGRAGWAGNSNGWKESRIVLKELDSAGANVRFRFAFSSFVNTPADGISIDNFSLRAASLHDGSLEEVVYPQNQAASGQLGRVTYKLQNRGIDTLTSIPMWYTINGGTPVMELWVGSLAMYEADTFTFSTMYTVPAGDYTVCVFLGPDDDTTNNTNCKTVHGLQTFNLPYSNSFDATQDGWRQESRDNLTMWEHGTPAYGLTNSAHSTPSAWDINLTSVYRQDAQAYLYSPFFNFNGIYSARLHFWLNHDSQLHGDGMQMEYSKNEGATWNRLDIQANPYAQGWYNDTLVPGKPAWAGTSAAWYPASLVLSELDNAGRVQFRYAFTSNATVQTSGVSIDDFSIARAADQDAAAVSLVTPARVSQITGTDSIRARIRNMGMLPITGMNIVTASMAEAPLRLHGQA